MTPETKKILQDKANEKYPYPQGVNIENAKLFTYKGIEDLRRTEYIAACTDCFDIAVKFAEFVVNGNNSYIDENTFTYFIENIYGK